MMLYFSIPLLISLVALLLLWRKRRGMVFSRLKIHSKIDDSIFWGLPYDPVRSACWIAHPLLKEIQQILSRRIDNRHSVLVLQGEDGSGRIDLTVSYAVENQHRYRRILFIDASTEYSFRWNLAQCLPWLTGRESSFSDWSLSAEVALHWFSRNRNWLLVLLNAHKTMDLDGLDAIREYGHVLITSEEEPRTDFCQCLQISASDGERALAYAVDCFRVRFGRNPSDAERGSLRELSQRFHGHPLSLEMAISAAKNGGFPDVINGMCSLLQGKRTCPLVCATEVTVSTLPRIGRELLELSAILGLYPAPFSDEEKNRRLNSFSVDRLNGCEVLLQAAFFRHMGNYYTLHETVRAYVLDHLDADNLHRLFRLSVEILCELVRHSYPEHRVLQSVYNLIVFPFKLSDFHADYAWLLEWSGDVCLKYRQLDEAKGFFDAAEKHFSKNKKADLLLLHIKQIYIRAELSEPLADEAIDSIMAAFFAKENELQEDLAADAARLIAHTVFIQRQFERADGLYPAVRERLAKSLGDNSPAMQLFLSKYASLLITRGRFKTAEEIQSNVLSVYMNLYGPDDLSTALGKWDLANTLLTKHDFSQAESFFRESLTIFVHELGALHPTALKSRVDLVNCLLSARRAEDARKEFFLLQELRPRSATERRRLSEIIELICEYFNLAAIRLHENSDSDENETGFDYASGKS